MGFTPQAVNAMSIWQFMVALDGYADAHAADDGSMSTQEVDEVWAWMQARDA